METIVPRAASALSTPLSYLRAIGPERAELLKKELSLFNFGDLLNHFPFRYIDRGSINKVSALRPDMPFIQVLGRVEKLQEAGEGRSRRLVATFRDDTGVIELVWFNKLTYISKIVQPGKVFVAFGKPNLFSGRFSITHPELETVLTGTEVQALVKIQPVYNSTEKLKVRGLDSKGFERAIAELLPKVAGELDEFFSEEMLQKNRLLFRKHAFLQIHHPEDVELLKRARFRLKFEELFFIQFRMLKQRADRDMVIKGHVLEKLGSYFNDFYNNHLPFQLTEAQKRVLREVRVDVRSGKQMNRLIQGDVGSGKTVVALMSMLMALDNGMQACLMAPTEILATQHYQNLDRMLFGLGVSVKLLTGSTPTSERKAIDDGLKNGTVHIIIGTHAVLENWVQYANLGLVVIDEQHRFGVAQRARLWMKNKIPPHILVMTATPIPRTLAMTLYGDLDVSVIDELPPGRKEIKTVHYFDKDRLKVFGFMRKQIAEGRQVYVVYPLIEESATLDYNNLMQGYEAIEREFPLPQYKIGIVHGRMSAQEKEFEMQRFKRNETQIMVSTTVIEVGVDVPNATVMVIESAERFGLSQLHQLRGRVGRGGNQSFCILMTGYKLSNEGRTRMETMVRTNNGFEISEVDLRLRGPGDLTGTQQSGILNLKLANLTTDAAILQAARHTVQNLLEEDPKLEKPENQPLCEFIRQEERNKPNWGLIS